MRAREGEKEERGYLRFRQATSTTCINAIQLDEGTAGGEEETEFVQDGVERSFVIVEDIS